MSITPARFTPEGAWSEPGSPSGQVSTATAKRGPGLAAAKVLELFELSGNESGSQSGCRWGWSVCRGAEGCCPDEGHQRAGLLAGQLFPKRRHSRPLAFQNAYDQLGIGLLRVPGTNGKVRDGWQAVPDRAPLTVGSMAPGAQSLEGRACLPDALLLRGRWRQRGVSRDRAGARPDGGGMHRCGGLLTLLDHLSTFPERPHERNHLLHVDRPQFTLHARHRLPLALEDRMTQFRVAASDLPPGRGEIGNLWQ